KKLYCWEEGGRKLCGDSLPATAVDRARTEISAKSGLASGRVARALSAEERAAAEAQVALDIENAAAAAAAARRDMAMVESYANETELQRAFQHRINLLDETLKSSRFGVDGMRQSLLSLLQRASDSELAGKPVAKPLVDNIRTQHLALRRQQDLLVEQQIELSEVDQELAAALERYRALKKPANESNG
ncbi:MAG: hypothetical protein M3414_05120, partial [Pseudomonadota bacterium]|nr:hypothetical protein [Pseudomonadota bacterium]